MGAVTKEKESSTATPGETGGTDGLGCVGDGEMAFCTYRGTDPNPGNLVAYDYDLVSQWDSGMELNQTAYASMPVIRQDASGGNGNVIAVDSARIIEFNRANGNIVWARTLGDGGFPTGPIITQGGGIVFATLNGPVYLYDGNSALGAPRGSLLIQDTVELTCFDGTGIFDSNNVAASAAGDIVYVNTRCREQDGAPDTNDLAWIARLDVDPAFGGAGLTLKHHFEFNGPSFASPLIVGNDIYFDGVDAGGTKIIKIRDTGTSFEEQLRVPVATSPRASFALDPRADSFWHPVYNRVVRRSLNDLSHMGVIDVEGLIDDQDSTNFRVGVLTIAGDATNPVLLTSASHFRDMITYVVAVDLMNGQLLWKVKFGGITEPGLAYDRVLSQFPILTNGGVAPPRVIFTGGVDNAPGGVYAVGEAP